MLISDYTSLSRFLVEWYGADDLSLPPEKLTVDTKVPKTLHEIWARIGRLSKGYDDWVRIGEPSPLASQDGLVAPGHLIRRNGFVRVVSENQGNWSMGYREDDKDADPKVYSDWLDQMIGGVGYVPVGCLLSELITTSVLTETLFFGILSSDDASLVEKECTVDVWKGHYYNAVGYGSEYENPSHRIRTSPDRSLLALDCNGKFTGFVGSAEMGRRRFNG